MIDLTTIPNETLLARGVYSTVRAAHEDEKKELQKLCGQLSSVASQVLRTMQPDNDDVPPSVDELLVNGRRTLDAMEACTQRIASLAKQRQEVKQQAWGKR
jgi:hypothetical protein